MVMLNNEGQEKLDYERHLLEVNQLKEEITQMKRNISSKFSRIDKNAKQKFQLKRNKFEKLRSMQDKVESNKQLLKSNIVYLEKRKEKSILACFKEVNDNLQSIFEMLLPGGMARMELREVPRKSKPKSKWNQAQQGNPEMLSIE